jgi:hypothetical protein
MNISLLHAVLGSVTVTYEVHGRRVAVEFVWSDDEDRELLFREYAPHLSDLLAQADVSGMIRTYEPGYSCIPTKTSTPLL